MLTFEPGTVLRTADLSPYDKNPTRLASKLVTAGKLRRLRKGVYYVPRISAFGEVPPLSETLLKSYFRGRPYLRTGPSVWNALGLGGTAVEVVPLVYNTTRTGLVELGGRRFELRRVRFPRKMTAEYLVVDLLENLDRAGVGAETVVSALERALKSGRYDKDKLVALAQQYGTRRTQRLVQAAAS